MVNLSSCGWTAVYSHRSRADHHKKPQLLRIRIAALARVKSTLPRARLSATSAHLGGENFGVIGYFFLHVMPLECSTGVTALVVTIDVGRAHYGRRAKTNWEEATFDVRIYNG